MALYCTEQDVISMLKDDVINSIIGNSHIKDAAERQAMMLEITTPALQDACAEVDGYLAKRYPVPLAAPPQVIVKYTKDIAIYNLISRMGVITNEREDNYRERYKYAIKFLSLVAEGKVALGIQTESPSAAAATGTQISGPERLFSRKSMHGM